MKIDWRQLLQDQDIEFVDGRPQASGGPGFQLKSAVEDGIVAPLPEVGVIRVSGADATTFLQTQLTQDVAGMGDDHWRFAGYCNPKGRLFGLFRVLLSDEGILLLTHRGLVESLLKRLRMFVMRSKVVLEDVSDENAAIGIAGPAALASLENLVGSVPEGQGHVHRAGDVLVLALGGTPDRLMVLASGNEVGAIWQTLSKGINLADPDTWNLLDIRAGWPQIVPETSEAFVPQQVNLDLIEGVSFKKGCFPGQEIVARMHYLGKPSRRMRYLKGPDGTPPAPGTKVTLADGGNAGEVVLAARGPDGLELLAVVQNKYRDRQDLDVGGTKVAPVPLPYQVDEPEPPEAPES